MRIARRLALLAAAVAVLAAAAIAGGRFLGVRRVERSLHARIEEIDDQLGRGFLGKAEASLLAAAAFATSERDWLRLLKRARRIAGATGSNAEFSRLARQAAGRIPGSRPLARLSLYAQLRAGQKPAQLARGLAADPDAQYLLAEAWELAPASGRPAEDLPPELENLIAARLRPEAQNLRALAQRWRDPALLRDAGLAWLAAGDPAKAEEAFRELPDEPTARELRLAAAYDSGAWQQALGYLEQDSQPSLEMLLIRADLLMILARQQEAAGLYQAVIARDPRYFWSPYLNLAGILAGQGQDAGSSAALYFRAYELFPESEAAATALLAWLVRSGQPAAAYPMLESALRRFPDSLPLRWLLLELGRGDSDPRRYLAALRKLYEENPQNALLCRALTAHLLGLADPAGAWAVLEEYEGPGEEAWLLEARGLVRALQGDLTAGADFLQRSLAEGGDGRTRCNLAAVLAAAGDRDAAVRQLMQASGELSGRPRLASQAHARLAEQLAAGGNRAAARRESAYALELDPANGRALLLLRTLEAE